MAQSSANDVRVAHVALAVSDLDVSTRFYAEGLGFEPGPRLEIGDESAALSEVKPPVEMSAQFLTKEGVRIELMGWRTPAPVGTASQTRNQIGLTHLSFEVDDLDATQARLVELGGEPITRSELGPTITCAFLADPDGVRIELLERRAQGG